MPEPFRRTINVDMRDSEPDWTPFEPARAPDGALEREAVAMMMRE